MSAVAVTVNLLLALRHWGEEGELAHSESKASLLPSVACGSSVGRSLVQMNIMMIMTIHRARIYPRCNSMLITLERPQSSSWIFLSLIVRAGYVCVAIIHRTLTWTTGSLSCAQMLVNACDCTRGVYGHRKRESARKVDSGRKIPCRTGESNLRQRRDGPML